MVYELLDNLSYWLHLVICLITRKTLNLNIKIRLSLKDTAREKSIGLAYSIYQE